ncbi:iron chelate uptake ABC transporter family permease subunit [Candidatus Aerophobetes bacterium]|nr:iron chelate uptake ABC transporter family permease subunit [Candidatus Aerophobetes bacterium]
MLYKKLTILGFLSMVALLSMGASLSIGTVPIPLSHTFRAVIGKIPYLQIFVDGSIAHTYLMILFDLRFPRILLTMLVGAGLATAGCCMQGLFRNPMASPYVIGISSGSAFGAALALLIIPGLFSVPLSAFIFGVSTTFLVYRISRRESRVFTQTLLLAGIAVGFFFSAITSLLMYMAAESVHRLVFWIMGGFWNSSWMNLLVAFPFIGFGIPAIYLFARDLNILQLGEDSAAHLGVEVERTKKFLLIFASLITASAVSVSGIIGFVGLIVPHITRLLVGPDHRILIPTSALVGAILLMWCDTLARVIITPAELPVGIITACFGAPFFIYLLIRKKSVGYD